MAKLNSLIFKIFIPLFLICMAIWWLIGPDWRQLIRHFPTDIQVLSWSKEQRDSGFRMLDRVPFMAKIHTLSPSDHVRTLPEGEPLDLEIDFEEYFQKARHAGLIIIHNGTIRLEHYGLDFEPNKRWTSFSVAKSFTSTLVGAAIKDGYIQNLSDPISLYIKGLQGTPYDDVTVEQLLTMTSGIAWNEDYQDPRSDVALFNQHHPPTGVPIIVDYFQNAKRAHPPGDVWNYSTGETNLIGILVSEATGQNLADYATEKIWKPAGMQHKGTWILGADGQEISGCCIQATTRDFARYGLFMLNGATTTNGLSIVPESWVEAATSQQIGIGVPGHGYGYQWWIYEDGAYAAQGIFGQGIFIDPKRQLVIASNGNWTTATGWDNGERILREQFYKAVQIAIDAEGHTPSRNTP